MKTAMQELIEELQKMYYDVNFPNSAKEGLIIAISTAGNQLKSLEKEKQQILSAYDAGKEQPSNSQQCPIDYYDQNFK